MHVSRIAALWIILGLHLSAQETALIQEAVPAGTILQIRLRQTLSSMTSKVGQPVSAMVIQPVVTGGATILPMKSLLEGQITQVRRVGLGFSRETAVVTVDFKTLLLPNEARLPIQGRVSVVNDSRETVDDAGRIHGIRASASFASVISGIGISAASVDPVLLAFALSSSLSVFRIPESEILLPAGSELSFQLSATLETPATFPAPIRSRLETEAQRAEWSFRLQSQPFRTATASGTPSDIASIAYVGSATALTNAFDAAGWAHVDRLDADSSYHAMRSIIENQGYRSAPMSRLLLDGEDPTFEFSKTLNTFFKRHHLRVYGVDVPEVDSPVWTSTATHDSGIAFSRASKTFIHLIDPNIDVERDKVVDDLVLTGCVDTVDYLDRPWMSTGLKNATGDDLVTDGRIAVVFLNACENPERADAESDPPKKVREPVELRPLRDVLLKLKNDAFRGNIGYQSVAGARMIHHALHKSDDPESPRVVHFGGEDFEVVLRTQPTKTQKLPRDPGERISHRKRSYASLLDLSINAGFSEFGNGAYSSQTFRAATADISVPVSLQSGWALSPKVTLNFSRHFSSEFSFTSNQTKLHIDGIPSLGELPQTMTARVRQFGYNLIVHVRPNGKRFRPYVAAGPAFQLIRAAEAKPTANRLLHFVFADLSIIQGAYEFGSKPPLEGGGIFQFGVQYGGGFKYQVTPRYFWRMDFRETLSRQPDFWSDSADKITANSTLPLQVGERSSGGPFRHNSLTMGFGISF